MILISPFWQSLSIEPEPFLFYLVTERDNKPAVEAAGKEKASKQAHFQYHPVGYFSKEKVS